MCPSFDFDSSVSKKKEKNYKSVRRTPQGELTTLFLARESNKTDVILTQLHVRDRHFVWPLVD